MAETRRAEPVRSTDVVAPTNNTTRVEASQYAAPISSRRYIWLFANMGNDKRENRKQIMQYDRYASIGGDRFILRDETPLLAHLGAAYFANLGGDMILGHEKIKWHIEHEREAHHIMSLHEVILDVRPRRLVIDMDKGDEARFTRIMNILAANGRQYDASLEFWDAYDSSGAHKFSRHIISRYAIARNSTQACAIMRHLLHNLDQNARACIDNALLMPKRVQNLRMCYSSKQDADGTFRTKIPMIAQCGADWNLQRSFIQYTADPQCVMLPDVVQDDNTASTERSMIAQGGDSLQIDALKQWCAAHGYRVGENIGVGLLDLPRERPSHCATCARVHDNRGAYSLIAKRTVRIRCRRADDEEIEGYILIWEHVDYRADFTDPRGSWTFADCNSVPRDLTTAQGRAGFLKFAQRNIAYISCSSKPYFLLRIRDSFGSLTFVATDTIDGRTIAKFLVSKTSPKDGTLTTIEVPFSRAIEGIREELTYPGVDFVPYFRGAPNINPAYLNLWMGYTRGSSVSLPIITDETEALAGPFLEHIRHIWCRDEAHMFEYVLNWFAYLIQYPGNADKRTALIVKGPQGCGKTGPVEYFGKEIIGAHYFLNVPVEHLMERFNADLAQRILVIVDETHQSEMSQSALESHLKSAITGTTMPIEHKFMDREVRRKALHFIFASNSALPIRIESAERRYVVLECAPVPAAGRSAYFDRLFAHLAREDVKQAIFTFFATRNLASFDVTKLPINSELARCKVASLSLPQQFLFELARGQIAQWPTDDQEYKVPAQEFYAAFTQWCATNGVRSAPTKQKFDQGVVGTIGGTTQIRTEEGRRQYMRSFTLVAIRTAFMLALDSGDEIFSGAQ
jgi:hypothetical protein